MLSHPFSAVPPLYKGGNIVRPDVRMIAEFASKRGWRAFSASAGWQAGDERKAVEEVPRAQYHRPRQ